MQTSIHTPNEQKTHYLWQLTLTKAIIVTWIVCGDVTEPIALFSFPLYLSGFKSGAKEFDFTLILLPSHVKE